MQHAVSLRLAALRGIIVFLSYWIIPISLGAGELAPLGETILGQEFVHKVARGETLTIIGARYGASSAVIARENGLRSTGVLKVGATLKVDNRHIVPTLELSNGILINIPQRMLFHFQDAAARVAYPVGLGRPDWPTPTGQFRVNHAQQDKAWIVPRSIQDEMRREGKEVLTCVPPGPDNPLGRHWIGLTIGGIGIHGTIAPSSVYHFRSHGCVRLHPDDVAELFVNVSIGEPGAIIYLPVLVAQVDGRLFLEVHEDVYKHGVNPLAVVRGVSEGAGLDDLIDWGRVDVVIEEKAGVAREIGRQQHPID